MTNWVRQGPSLIRGTATILILPETISSYRLQAIRQYINSGNVPTASTGNTSVDRLFGLEGSWGQDTLGLSQTVAQDVVRELGNYGEVYDRHFGIRRAGRAAPVRQPQRAVGRRAVNCTQGRPDLPPFR